jgi:hypothetical protein
MSDPASEPTSKFMSYIGEKGGLVASGRQRRAARRNLVKARRKKRTLDSNRLRDMYQRAAAKRAQTAFAKEQWRAFIV